jgi:glucose/arabinose dehydrogenase
MVAAKPSVRRSLLAALLVVAATTVVAAPARAATITARPVATGLAFPAAFTFAPDGRIFYGERFTGQIRVLDPSSGSNTLLFTVPNLATTGEQGLLGIALDPAYPTRPFVYVYATRVVAGTTENQIIRLRDTGGTGSGMKIIYHAPASTVHNGGRILFGPDKKLYVVVGDGQVPANAQNLSDVHGKILRMTPAGLVPQDNPFPNSLVWSYGHRNSFGFTFDPQTRLQWETENGPECNDELNRIVKGANFGWGPSETCSSPPPAPADTNRDGPDPVLPLRFYTPTVAPTGAAFCTNCGLGAGAEGTLFYGTYNTSQIRQVTLDASRRSVASESPVLTNPGGGVLAIERAPSGALYFSDQSGIYQLVMS